MRAIKFKILLSIFPVLIITISAVSIYSIFNFQKNYVEAIKWRSIHLTKNVGTQINEMLKLADFNKLSKMHEFFAKVMKNNEGITYLYIADPDLQIKYHIDKNVIGKVPLISQLSRHKFLGKDDHMIRELPIFYEAVVPVYKDSIPAGSLHIGTHKKFVTDKIMQIIYVGLIALGLSLILIAVFSFGSIKKLIANPILQLDKSIKEIIKGNLNFKIDIKSHNELAALAVSFNTMSKQLHDKQKKSAEYLLNMEEKLEKKNKDLISEKQKVFRLLANLKQSIFSVNSQMKITKPVSEHALLVLGDDILGQNVFDLIFGDMDRESKEFSLLNENLQKVFETKAAGWYDFAENFPSKILFKSQSKTIDQKNEKLFSINYFPLVSQDQIIEKVVFAVEDITEICELTEQMTHYKGQEEKRTKITAEVAANEKDQLIEFFDTAASFIDESIEVANKLSFEDSHEVIFSEMFAKLQSFKSNAGVFHLSYISNKIVQSEKVLLELKEKITSTTPADNDWLAKIRLEFYTIGGEIQQYALLASYIFITKNKFEKHFSKPLLKHLVWLDYILNLVSEPLSQYRDYQINVDLVGQHLKLLKQVTTDVKSALLCINLVKPAKMVQRLENALEQVSRLTRISNEEFTNLLLEPIREIKTTVKSQYVHSILMNEYSLDPNKWVLLFMNLHELTQIVFDTQQDDVNDAKAIAQTSVPYLQSFMSEAEQLDLNYLVLALLKMEDLLRLDANETGQQIKSYKDHLYFAWYYLQLVCYLEFTLNSTEQERQGVFAIIDQLMTKDIDDDLMKEFNNVFLMRILRELNNDGISSTEFFAHTLTINKGKDQNPIKYFLGFEQKVKIPIDELMNQAISEKPFDVLDNQQLLGDSFIQEALKKVYRPDLGSMHLFKYAAQIDFMRIMLTFNARQKKK